MRQTLTVELLERLYHKEHKSTEEIAAELGWSSGGLQKAMHRLGIQLRKRGPPRGEHHPDWKGGKTRDRAGYVLVYCPDHPRAKLGRYVQEHRLVMEQHLGRYLEPQEVVHHKNDIRDDNRIENLQLFANNTEHLRRTLKRCPKWTEAGRQRILSAVAARKIALPEGDELIRLYREHGPKRLAKMYGCNASTVTNRVRKMGYNFRDPEDLGFGWPKRSEFVQMLYSHRPADIARHLGKSVPAVYGRMSSLGLDGYELSRIRRGLRQPATTSDQTHLERGDQESPQSSVPTTA